MQQRTVIAVMAKQPQVGRTKTRLCPPFEPHEAAGLYEALLRDSILLAHSVPGASLAAAITPPDSRHYFTQICPPGTLLLPVEGADIGVCLSNCIEGLLSAGFHRVLAMNVDGPSLPPEYLQQGAAALADHDVVLGPGEDGGYYLIGMRRFHAGLFQNIAWSSPYVLEQTLDRVQQYGLRARLLPAWYDVDTPDDAARLARELRGLPASALPHTRAFMAQCTRPALFER